MANVRFLARVGLMGLLGAPMLLVAPMVDSAVAVTASRHHGGVVTIYTDPSIDLPADIAAGPDGALWFANELNGSIGRIATNGDVTNYTGTGISAPVGITAGPDGALWFTNYGTTQ